MAVPTLVASSPARRICRTADAPAPTLLEGFTYDATGNRTSHTEGAATTAYGYPAESHRLIDVGGTARSYDNVGNTLQRGPAPHDAFTYGDNNRLLRSGPAVGAPDAQLAMNYVHNGRGERVRKAAGRCLLPVWSVNGNGSSSTSRKL